MEEKNLVVDSISLAAYLFGPCQLKLLEINKDEITGRFSFTFDVNEKDGEKYVLNYGNSESLKFDQAVQFLKNRVFKNTRRSDRR